MLAPSQASRLEHVALRANQLVATCLRIVDRKRAWLLRRTLRISALRALYTHRPLRLFSWFCVLTACYLPMALLRPDLLLVLGPLLLGYPHLIASYRYIQPGVTLRPEFKGDIQVTRVLLTTTLVILAFKTLLKQSSVLPPLPYGAWEIVAALSIFIWVGFFNQVIRLGALLSCLALSILLLKLAWWEPLVFVAAVLILHNWIAFAYWMLAARSRQEKGAALCAIAIFGVIHCLIYNGSLDVWMPGTLEETLHMSNSEVTAWALAPWSTDPLVWRRALTIYAFGLSMHYFVWLKALPESLSRHSSPNSFALSFDLLRRDLGSKITCIAFLVGLTGVAIWIFSPALGASLYFAVASLHGWLEINRLVAHFLPTTVFPKNNRAAFSETESAT